MQKRSKLIGFNIMRWVTNGKRYCISLITFYLFLILRRTISFKEQLAVSTYFYWATFLYCIIINWILIAVNRLQMNVHALLVCTVAIRWHARCRDTTCVRITQYLYKSLILSRYEPTLNTQNHDKIVEISF